MRTVFPTGIDEQELVVEGDTEPSNSLPLDLLLLLIVGDVMTATLECETVYLCLTNSPVETIED